MDEYSIAFCPFMHFIRISLILQTLQVLASINIDKNAMRKIKCAPFTKYEIGI
jgi:hypothetical protein